MTEQRGINSVHKALIDEGDDMNFLDGVEGPAGVVGFAPGVSGCAASDGNGCKSDFYKGATEADVRGDHYAKHGIDPWGYGMLAGLDPLQFSVVKYVTRFRDKGGLDDLRKAENALKRLIAFDYGSAVGD